MCLKIGYEGKRYHRYQGKRPYEYDSFLNSRHSHSAVIKGWRYNADESIERNGYHRTVKQICDAMVDRTQDPVSFFHILQMKRHVIQEQMSNHKDDLDNLNDAKVYQDDFLLLKFVLLSVTAIDASSMKQKS